MGATSYRDPRVLPKGDVPTGDALFAIEVGFTWLAASAQGTGLKTEAKFRHACENWAAARVDMKTDARNDRCRAALASVGARFEAVPVGQPHPRNWSRS